ncbi:MAG TPA: serine hydrolase [Vicinamibacterales bacterium]|nr:serine hydrolase [Vicinamibacterales bacterium]
MTKLMRRLASTGVLLAVSITVLVAAREQAAARHFPPAGNWEKRDPASLGLDQAKLDEAIKAALATENTNTKDLAVDIPNTFRNEAPYNNLIGPTQERAGANLVVIYKGYAVAAAGDNERADMTFSVTKTFLSTVVGEAFERGLIKNLNDKVGPYMPKGVDLFASEHNAKITWDHLLRQTSDWSGTLWGKPDWADRPPPGQTDPKEWEKRELVEPGTKYKYNDTRVNVLALATLYLFKEPLPSVLKREIMDPIGASSTWHWEPYENAYVTIDGKKMPSIPGGGHHGGGMFINAWDMARFGYLFLANGKWGTRQLVAEKWIAMARTPGVRPDYGFMNWMLNADRPNRVSFQGNGPNTIYIDWTNDLVVVTRWLRGGNRFVDSVVAGIKK